MAEPTRKTTTRPSNLILSQMPEEQFRTLARAMVPVDLPVGMKLSEPNEPVDCVYFPVSGLISIDALTDKGESVEVGVIGREGLAGVCGLLGHPQMGHSVIMQGPGSGFRVRMSLVREEFLKGGPFADTIHTFIYLQTVQISQSVLCNRLHPVESRIARWLLTASDRMETSQLSLTQEYLAQMLGARRATVTVAAGTLQRARLIEYTRGRVKIIDRPGLEAKACECYQLVRAKYEQTIGTDY